MGCCDGGGEKSRPRGGVNKPVGVQSVDSDWRLADRLGRLKVRLGFGRDNYRVEPGLYALGNPGRDAQVFVTANYKLSFDLLRRSLYGRAAYILVLDTKGINVWCAAGKGTFGTEELVNRILITDLEQVVDTRELILPQLGAPGVSAHRVKKLTGFRVLYGPVRSVDIPRFLDAGKKADNAMRLVSFNLAERLEIAPLEFIQGLKYLLWPILALFVLSFLPPLAGVSDRIRTDALFFFAAYAAGSLAVPIFLPVLPGKLFSIKGAVAGLVVMGIMGLTRSMTGTSILVYLILMLPVSAFLAMNFTGATPYTNLTGVEREIKMAAPVLATVFIIGCVLKGLEYGGII